MAKKIIIADDDLEHTKLVSLFLESKGFQVIPTIDGEETLKRVQEEKPALVIVDLKLPKIDGWRVCHQIKSNEETKHIPVIVLSGLIVRSGEKNPDEEGDFYFPKPFELDELLEKIRELTREPVA